MPKQSVAVQTSPKHFPSMKNYNNSLVNDITPNHFTKVQTSKLEDAFCQKTKPDEITMKVLAMESNLLYRDVEAWFKHRRLQWINDVEKSETVSLSKSNDEIMPDVQC